MMASDEVTIAEVLKQAGYQTAMFGKWHLGDNAPVRAHDQGFDHALYHGGGGIWQTPDYYGNDYFDDTYFENGVPRKFSGYCTDVWFDEASKYIRKASETDKPFFVYISTNAPHGPLWVADKHADPYQEKGVPENMSKFYGMITNIDENVGQLRNLLSDLNLSDNTLFIFTTDNGTAGGGKANKQNNNKWTGFNAGMRGQKGSEYDGGHRVPFFAYWPHGGVHGGKDVDLLTAHVDVLPTLVDVAGINNYKSNKPIDGTSILNHLQGKPTAINRTLFVHSQRIFHPEKGRKYSVMTEDWRLVNGQELFQIQNDPGQQNNIIKSHPQVAMRLSEKYDAWWKSINTRFDEFVHIDIGSDAENPALITAHDWEPVIGNAVPWNQGAVDRHPYNNGKWRINVTQSGKYEFILRRKPAYSKTLLTANKASLFVGDNQWTTVVPEGASGVRFIVDLKKGQTTLLTELTDSNGKTRGAFFIEVKRL